MYQVAYGDKILPIFETVKSKDGEREWDECTALKIVNKCEFLDNFEIHDIIKIIDYYGVMNIKDFDLEEGETTTLEEYHNEPDTDIGEIVEFTGKLYGKNVKITVGPADHCDNLGIEDGWIAALNVLLSAFYYYNEDLMEKPEYQDLYELHTVEHKVMWGLSCQYVAKLCNKYGKEKALKIVKEVRPKTTLETIEDYLVDYSNKVTIEDYMKTVDCDDKHYVEIKISRDKVVYRPEVKEL